MSTCARRKTYWEHLFNDHWWLPLTTLIAIIVFFVWLVFEGINKPVVDQSLSGEAWEIKPDGTQVPLDPKDSRSHDVYKIP